MKLLLISCLLGAGLAAVVNCNLNPRDSNNACQIQCTASCKIRVSGCWGNHGQCVNWPSSYGGNEAYGVPWLDLGYNSGNDCRGGGRDDWRHRGHCFQKLSNIAPGCGKDRDCNLNCSPGQTVKVAIVDTDWGDNSGSANIQMNCAVPTPRPTVPATPRPTTSPSMPPTMACNKTPKCLCDRKNSPKKNPACSEHKTKNSCLKYINQKAKVGKGKTALDKLCGWSKAKQGGPKPYFGKKATTRCRSLPNILRTLKVSPDLADWGTCKDAAEEEAAKPTDPPVAPTRAPSHEPTMPEGQCSDFHGDKKGCKKAGVLRGQTCSWDKKKDLCQAYSCDSFTGAGPIRCGKKGKKFGLTCYFNVETKVCGADEITGVACSSYKKKKYCKKMGGKYSNCKYDKKTKDCLDG